MKKRVLLLYIISIILGTAMAQQPMQEMLHESVPKLKVTGGGVGLKVNRSIKTQALLITL